MNRRNVRNWTVITDIILINLAFAFAYVVRYDFQWLLPVTIRVPYDRYIGQQLLLTVLLSVFAHGISASLLAERYARRAAGEPARRANRRPRRRRRRGSPPR